MKQASDQCAIASLNLDITIKIVGVVVGQMPRLNPVLPLISGNTNKKAA